MNVIITACDNNYAIQLGVMLQSLIHNSKNRRSLFVNIIDGGIDYTNKLNLENILKENNIKYQFLYTDAKDIVHLKIDKHLSLATYYRLLIPQLLDNNIEKVLYLDSDIIVNNEIVELCKKDIANYSIAAVETPLFDRHKELFMDIGAKYFNAGVLLINLRYWRENNISNNIIDFIRKNPERVLYHDQDGMNSILYNNWLPLDVTWNMTSQLLYLVEANQVEIPNIIHYTEASKPWQLLNNHPFKKEYEKYLAMTPWKDDIPPENAIIHKLLMDKRIIIFGSGGSGLRLLERVMELNGTVSYFLDNNKELSGKEVNGKKIHTPNVLADENIDEIFIIIASMYYVDIEKQLTELGLKRLKHFVSLGYENELLKEW